MSCKLSTWNVALSLYFLSSLSNGLKQLLVFVALCSSLSLVISHHSQLQLT